MSYQKDREEFIAVLTEELQPRAAASTALAVARELMRRANTSQRLAAVFCSVELSPSEQERLDRQDEKNDAAIEALCEKWGLVPVLSGDPRGSCVKVKLPSGRYNSWGGPEHGFCVPTREY